jgi:hypothetical protein
MDKPTRDHLRRVIEYLYEDERRDSASRPDAHSHIFFSVVALKEWLEEIEKRNEQNGKTTE